MSVAPNSIKPGHCYHTEGKQHRRVTQVAEDGTVTYEAWDGVACGGATAPQHHAESREVFIEAVTEEIGCPEPARETPSQAEGERDSGT